MKCPKCNAEIYQVFIISRCSQKGTLVDSQVINYTDLDILETLEIQCPECGVDIISEVEL